MTRWLVLALSLFVGCSDSENEDAGGRLQSDCVRENLPLPRTLQDGSECDNFGSAGCGKVFASECIGFCAFDVCQSGPCTADTDCAPPAVVCLDYVIDGVSFDTWCGPSPCPQGEVGCPCGQAGTCSGSAVCNENNLCELNDSCAAGCRQGSVCCGGLLCSGNCIGTPCC